MSDELRIKEVLAVQGLTTISKRELAELRAELELAKKTIKILAESTTALLARAEEAEAANVALQDKLDHVRYCLAHGDVRSANDGIDALLAAADPGAKVRAVVKAAQRLVSREPQFMHSSDDRILLREAVRALDEGSKP